MAYNAGFPATYTPIYYAPQYQTPPSQNNTNSIIWVSGEAGAKAYLVAPNTTVQLWDSEAQVIYLKSADASGMPSMKILEYTIRNQTPANAPITATNASPTNIPDYVTKAEFDALQGEIEALKNKLNVMTNKEASA